MNQKQLEIFKKWRAEKYEIDLERLREDLAAGGLVSSGIRNKKEEWLKKEYEAEVAREDAETEDYEREKRAKRSERVHAVIINAVLALTAVISAGGSVLAWQSSDRANQIAQKQLLPQFEANSMVEGLNTPSSSESIIFENHGNTCNDLFAVDISFLEVAMTENKLTKVYIVPFDGYLNWRFIDGCKTVKFTDKGESEWDGGMHYYADYNYAVIGKLHSQVSVLAFASSSLASVLPLNFVRLTYQDVFGNGVTEYYKFWVTSDVKISTIEGEQMFKLHDTREHLSLSSTAAEVMRYISSREPDYQYMQQQ